MNIEWSNGSGMGRVMELIRIEGIWVMRERRGLRVHMKGGLMGRVGMEMNG